MDRERLDEWCEKGILGVVLAILVFSPLATGSVRLVDFSVILVLTLIGLLLWIGRLFFHGHHRLLWAPICWPLLMFVGYTAYEYQQAEIEYAARQELIKVGVYFSLFLLILNNLHRQESTRLIAMVLIGVAVFVSFYAIFQFLTKSNHVWHFIRSEQYKGRGSGSFICPNHLAGYLEMIWPLALSFTLLGRFKDVTKVVFGYAALVIPTAIALTLSRGGWVVSGVILLLFCGFLIRRREYRLQALILMVVLVIGAFLFVGKVWEFKKRMTKTLTPSLQLSDDRVHIWRSAVNMWKAERWEGVGPGHFDHKYPVHRHLGFQMRPRYVHNDFLQLLVEWGIIGAALIGVAILMLFYGVVKCWPFVQRGEKDIGGKKSNKGAFVFGAGLGLVAIALHSFGDFNLQIPSNAILAVTLAALVTAHWRFATERYWVSLRWPLRTVLGLVLVSGIFLLGQEAVRLIGQVYYLRAAEAKAPYSLEQISLWKKAFAQEPKNYENSYAIGEALRLHAWQALDEAAQLNHAREALVWFERGIRLNPYDHMNYIRYGMCLHWLGRHEEAGEFFDQATQLDPVGYYTAGLQGWHLFQLGRYAEALLHFHRSHGLMPNPNPLAVEYIKYCQQRLQEKR